MNETLNKEDLQTNILIDNNFKTDDLYDVAYNIHIILSVLTFTVIVIFLYRYLKTVFKIRKG